MPSARVRGGSQPAPAACCQALALITSQSYVCYGGLRGPHFLCTAALSTFSFPYCGGLWPPGSAPPPPYSIALDKLLPFLGLSVPHSQMRKLVLDMRCSFQFENVVFLSKFSQPGNIDIWGRIILSCEGLLYPVGGFSSTPSLYPLDASSPHP